MKTVRLSEQNDAWSEMIASIGHAVDRSNGGSRTFVFARSVTSVSRIGRERVVEF